MKNFNDSYQNFKKAWESFSLEELEKFISKDYTAREIQDGKNVDFGYRESIEGWTQAFEYFSDMDAEWHITDIGFIPVKEDEMMAILFATLTVDGEAMKTANLFFDTFKQTKDGWEMIRSYIETGVPLDNINLKLNSGMNSVNLGKSSLNSEST